MFMSKGSMGFLHGITRPFPPRLWGATTYSYQPARSSSLSAIHRGLSREGKRSFPRSGARQGSEDDEGLGFRYIKEERNMRRKTSSERFPSTNNQGQGRWAKERDKLRSELVELEPEPRRPSRRGSVIDGERVETPRKGRFNPRDIGVRARAQQRFDGREDRPSASQGRYESNRQRTPHFRSREEESDRPTGGHDNNYTSRQRTSRFDRDGNGNGTGFTRNRQTGYDANYRQGRLSESRHDNFSPRSRFGNYDVPQSIPRATAASQFLYGHSVVAAALRAQKRKLYKLYIYRGSNRMEGKLEEDRQMTELAERANVPVQGMQERDQKLMDKMTQGRPHNGFVLEASPLPQLPINSLRLSMTKRGCSVFKVRPGPQSAEEKDINGMDETEDMFQYPSHFGRKPFVVLLDGIKDEGNLGGIIRSASFLGVDAVVISYRNTAKLTTVTLKASAGAAETMRLFSTPDPEYFVMKSREKGWKIYTSAPPAKRGGSSRSMNIYDLEAGPDPLMKNGCVLVFGGEGDGLAAAVRRHADAEVFIPDELSQNRDVESLNVSVAAGMLIGAMARPRIYRSRKTDEKVF
ncbi:hypothetical protein MKZ38_001808 [Zalerion maritima]|uniref:rRNA methyltransferase 1, mitochondrial n=1 Tax=Zalerion maritima TaxID=339359 RepID=A0AAD5RRE8_9PEZI|nr:hypothetical protein MKZ38_001808 [Zalerion maritima]